MKSLPVVLFCVLLLVGCQTYTSEDFSISTTNITEFGPAGRLDLKVCSSAELDVSRLYVTIYATENPNWRIANPVETFDSYLNREIIGIPGSLARPLPVEIWKRDSEGCLSVTLENTFVQTADWSTANICPFDSIIVVANYDGRLHASKGVECHLDPPNASSVFPGF
ncbi:MAG TPA: hypothetical protein VI703_06655 [Anaerolineales bacterium]|nr:hypothetical protein [Anaerolineales bacterium]